MALRFSDEQDDVLVEEVKKRPSLWLHSHPTYKDLRVKNSDWTEVIVKVGKSVDECKKRWRNIKDTYDRKKFRKTGLTAPPLKRGKKWVLESRLSFLQLNQKEDRGCLSNNDVTEEFTENNNSVVTEEFDGEPEKVEVINSHFLDYTNSGQISEPSSPCPPSSPTQYLLEPNNAEQYQHPSTQTEEVISDLTSSQMRTNHRKKIVKHLEKITDDQNDIIRTLLSTEKVVDDIDLFFQSIAKSVKKLSPPMQHCAKVETLNVIGKLEAETDPHHSSSFRYQSSSAPPEDYYIKSNHHSPHFTSSTGQSQSESNNFPSHQSEAINGNDSFKPIY